MKYAAVFCTAFCLVLHCEAEELSGPSEVLLKDDFERAELGKEWTVQTGNWSIIEGHLRGSEIEADNHSAAARRVLETTDASYELRFRFQENTRAFHFGFDPTRGSLDKKGHLFSVIVDPAGFKLLKHLDKNRPEEDPNEVLGLVTHGITANQWYTLRVTTRGTSVEATVEGVGTLSASHPTFSVPKPTLVFRVIGEGVDIDDLKVSALQD